MCDKVIVRIYMPYLFKTKLNRAYIVNLLFTKPVTTFISSQIILPLFLKIYSDFSVLVFQKLIYLSLGQEKIYFLI